MLDEASAIPIVNGIVAFIGIAVHWFVGFILWLIIQTIEVLPIILRRDRAFVRTLIQESEKQAHFLLNDNDDPALKALKRWYNQFPALTINRALDSLKTLGKGRGWRYSPPSFFINTY